MMDAKEYVSVKQFDVLLTDLKAENITHITNKNVQHLSSVIDVMPNLLGMTFGENAWILVKAIVSCSSKQGPQKPPVNVIMLVDTGSPYVFLTKQMWNALGMKLDDLPNKQAYVKINGMQVLMHVSSNHFEDIDVLGSSFLKNCKMTVDYPEQVVEIQVVTD